MLAGFHEMRSTPHGSGPGHLPLLHGLICIWNNNLLGASPVAFLPYDQYMSAFPPLPPAAHDGIELHAREARGGPRWIGRPAPSSRASRDQTSITAFYL